MAQFDVYRHPSQDPGEPVRYLLDLQAEMLDDLPTRVVAPLVPPEMVGPAIGTLNPRVYVHGEPFILLTHLLAAVRAKTLGENVGSARPQREEIIKSIDLLITGI